MKDPEKLELLQQCGVDMAAVRAGLDAGYSINEIINGAITGHVKRLTASDSRKRIHKIVCDYMDAGLRVTKNNVRYDKVLGKWRFGCKSIDNYFSVYGDEIAEYNKTLTK